MSGVGFPVHEMHGGDIPYESPLLRSPSSNDSLTTAYAQDETNGSDLELSDDTFATKVATELRIHDQREEEERAEARPLLIPRPRRGTANGVDEKGVNVSHDDLGCEHTIDILSLPRDVRTGHALAALARRASRRTGNDRGFPGAPLPPCTGASTVSYRSERHHGEHDGSISAERAPRGSKRDDDRRSFAARVPRRSLPRLSSCGTLVGTLPLFFGYRYSPVVAVELLLPTFVVVLFCNVCMAVRMLCCLRGRRASRV